MSSPLRMTGALSGAVAAALVLITISDTGVLAQQAIVVESAIPSVAAPATLNLNVSIKGKGFKRGARARFLVTGTENPGGITVNATAYVSSSEVVANIDVDADAALATFDIEIANDDDRTGKGTELFAVVSPVGNGASQAQCLPQGVSGAPGFVPVNELNGADGDGLPIYGARFGVNAKATRFGSVMLLAVGTRNTYDVSRIEIFHIAADGNRVDGTGTQSHQTLIAPIDDFGPNGLAWGDVDNNGAPDLVAVSTVSAAGYVFFGSVAGDGELTFSSASALPKGGRSRYGASVAVANFDGLLNGDEIAVGSIGGGSGKSAEQPSVLLYGYDGTSFAIRRTVTPSGLKNDDSYGWTLASGDIDGDGDIDLAVGAQNRDVNNITDSGAVYLHHGPLLAASGPNPALSTVVLTAPNLVKNEKFGQDVAIGNIDNDNPLEIIGAAEKRALIFKGSSGINAVPTLSSDVLTPEPGLEGGWPGRDILVANLSPTAPRSDVIIGAPNAARSNGCNSPGVTYAFLGSGASGFARNRLEANTDNGGFAAFGWSVAGIDGFPVLAVGEHHRRINGIEAGQVYLYLVP